MADDGTDAEMMEENFLQGEFIEDHFTKEVAKIFHAHTFDDVAALLLKENLLLTALELHTELIENGHDLPRLRDFFSNPGNFEKQAHDRADLSPGLPRTSSVQTFDSLDFARYSDDGEKQTDERVAVLEFELRKAKETIKSLRANLTYATESEGAVPDVKKDRIIVDETIKPHEKRAVNFLVNEYLLKHNYKLTSITFSDENEEQDFEDWDDVGLNIPKPPNLLCLYRDFTRHLHPQFHCETIGIQVNLRDEEILRQATIRKELESEISSMQEQIETLTKKNAIMTSQIKILQDTSVHLTTVLTTNLPHTSEIPEKYLADDHDCKTMIDSEVTCQGSFNSTEDHTTEEKTFATEKSNSIHSTSNDDGKYTTTAFSPLRKFTSEEFHRTLLDLCCLRRNLQDNRLAAEVADIAVSSDKIVLMLGRCLPHIVPNVILAKREELIPVILCTITLHPDAKERDKLLNILFNLIKRPDDDQRQMILTGFVTIAQQLGPTRVETELLPQCWEQITHKYIERRLLVAESSGILAPYLPSEICSSLVLSMLQQMLSDDKSELVREAVTKSLSVILSYINDDGKFLQGYQLVLTALDDTSENVATAAVQVLMPVFASWALELDRLETEICPAFLKLLEEKAKGLGEIPPNLISSNEERTFITIVNALRSMIPWLFLSIVQSGPFSQSASSERGELNTGLDTHRFPLCQSPLDDLVVITGDKQLVSALVRAFDKYIGEEWYESWQKFDWLNKTFLPGLLAIIEIVPVVYSNSVHELSVLFQDLSLTFGSKFVTTKLKPLFQSCLSSSNSNPNVSDDSPLAKSLVPVYVNGVLKIFFKEEDRKELSTFLQDLLSAMSLYQLPLNSIRIAIMELSSDPSIHELVIGVLWDSVVHSSSQVRATGARLFELLVRNVSEVLLATRVAPGLVTLANDSDIQVRIATIPAFGAIIEVTNRKELIDKVHMQFLSFLDDPQYQDQTQVLVELIRTFGQVAPNADPRFREEFVLPRLAIIASQNTLVKMESRKFPVAMALLEAYSSLSCCFMSDQLIAEILLPGLRYLLTDIQQLAPDQVDTVATMINELAAKVEIPRPAERGSSSFLNAAGMAPSSMEDVRNKMSKIFVGAATQGRANISNIFQTRKK